MKPYCKKTPELRPPLYKAKISFPDGRGFHCRGYFLAMFCVPGDVREPSELQTENERAATMSYAPINIRPHYPPYGTQVGIGGDYSQFAREL